MNTTSGLQVGGVLSNSVAKSSVHTLSSQDEFRLRMEEQCRQIKQYRQAMLRYWGRLLSPDEAALEWVERYAATFDQCRESSRK